MDKNQYVEYYNDLGKFKELRGEGLFYKYESEWTNGSLPFFVYNFSSSCYGNFGNSRK